MHSLTITSNHVTEHTAQDLILRAVLNNAARQPCRFGLFSVSFDETESGEHVATLRAGTKVAAVAVVDAFDF